MESITPEEVGMLRNLIVDTEVAVAFVEVLYLVKHTTFQINLGLQNLSSSNCLVTQKFYANSSTTVMQPVILITPVMLNIHLDKIVMQPGKGAHVKGIDSKVQGQLVALVDQFKEKDPGSAAVINCN